LSGASHCGPLIDLAHGATTYNIMTVRITALGIMTLSVVMLSAANFKLCVAMLNVAAPPLAIVRLARKKRVRDKQSSLFL
jgi:hypothetical protein